MKLLVNSYPRSGTTTFTNAVRSSFRMGRLNAPEDMYHNDTWISKGHSPVIFLSKFPKDILVSSILRDPVDAISSNSFRWCNGYTGNIVKGLIVVDKNQVSDIEFLDEQIKDLINHQIQQYVSYYTCLNTNSDIELFIYENINNNISESIDIIAKYFNYDKNLIDYSAAEYEIKNPPQPTKEKNQLYYDIREYIKNSKNIDLCYNLYNTLIERQKTK